ncbi:hypothetical protein Tco_0973747 [Tanacetum coccineum]|uniref:Uncharacterized protein n=1 Tax=Tanacetum coccineum TaxID=301880 RepID=A0ABQ5E9M5_9ASTR
MDFELHSSHNDFSRIQILMFSSPLPDKETRFTSGISIEVEPTRFSCYSFPVIKTFTSISSEKKKRSTYVLASKINLLLLHTSGLLKLPTFSSVKSQDVVIHGENTPNLDCPRFEASPELVDKKSLLHLSGLTTVSLQPSLIRSRGMSKALSHSLQGLDVLDQTKDVHGMDTLPSNSYFYGGEREA